MRHEAFQRHGHPAPQAFIHTAVVAIAHQHKLLETCVQFLQGLFAQVGIHVSFKTSIKLL